MIIGKALTSSLPFPLSHTVRETFASHGVPTNEPCPPSD